VTAAANLIDGLVSERNGCLDIAQSSQISDFLVSTALFVLMTIGIAAVGFVMV
jgi:hypothetical protein